MSYKIEVRHHTDSGSGISVEAKVNGEPVAHTFPKGMGFFEEPENGRPQFIEKLIDKYEEKMKREGNKAQTVLTEEERKIQGDKFVNQTFTERENFKQGNNSKDNMGEVGVEEVRNYLKDNMAEGYLSEEEEQKIDEFVDEYEQLLEGKENFQEIIRKIHTDRVQ